MRRVLWFAGAIIGAGLALPIGAPSAFACAPESVCEYNDRGSYSYMPPEGSWYQDENGVWHNDFPLIFNAPSAEALERTVDGAAQFSRDELAVYGVGTEHLESGEWLRGIYFADDGNPQYTPWPQPDCPAGSYGCNALGVTQINELAVTRGTEFHTTVHETCHSTVATYFPGANVHTGGLVARYGPGHGEAWHGCSQGHGSE